MKELGFSEEDCARARDVDPRTAFPFQGGETSGLERIQNYLFKTNAVAKYKLTRNGLLGNSSV